MRIKEARIRSGYSQHEFAERLDTTQGTVSKWELGITFPRRKMLEQIASLLGVSVSYLMGDEDDFEPENMPYLDNVIYPPEVAPRCTDISPYAAAKAHAAAHAEGFPPHLLELAIADAEATLMLLTAAKKTAASEKRHAAGGKEA